MTDYSQVDILASRHKSVNFGAEKGPGWLKWWAQIDCYREKVLEVALDKGRHEPFELGRVWRVLCIHRPGLERGFRSQVSGF